MKIILRLLPLLIKSEDTKQKLDKLLGNPTFALHPNELEKYVGALSLKAFR